MTIIYRNAVASDVIDLIGLVEDYCDEAGFKHELSAIKKYIDFQLGKVPTVIADNNGKVVGVISFMVTPSPFNSAELWGRKIACFVDKDYRDQGIGASLIQQAESFGKQAGATRFYFSSTDRPSEDYLIFESDYVKVL